MDAFAEAESARELLNSLYLHAGDHAGAAEDATRAEAEFKSIGDRVRRLLSAADGALALYGSGDVGGGVEQAG